MLKFFFLAGCLSLVLLGHRAGAATPTQRHGGNAPAAVAGSCDSLCQLFGTLARGEWKQVVAPGACGPGVSNYSCHALGVADGKWCADFDGTGTNCGAGSIFANAAAVQNQIYAVPPRDYPLFHALAYSAPGIRKADGMVVHRGGGHAASGDGSVMGFSVEAAAANIVGGGKGGDWKILVPGPRLLPYSAGRPKWSDQQNSCPTPSQAYWWTTNHLGQEMQGPPHSYWGITPIPGTTKWAMAGQYYGTPGCGFPAAAGGAGLIIDDATGVPTLVKMQDPQAHSADLLPGAYDDLDGRYYFQDGVYTLAGYDLSTGAQKIIPGNCAISAFAVYARWITFPDPESAETQRDILAIGNKSTALIQHLNSFSPTVICEHKDVPEGFFGVPAYDDDSGEFILWKGNGSIATLALDRSSPSKSKVTPAGAAPSGDVPTQPGKNGCSAGNEFLALEYLPARRPGSGGRAGIVAAGCGLVWVRAKVGGKW